MATPALLRSIAFVLSSLVLAAATPGGQSPLPDQGAAGTWQKLLKLRTTASAMHTTAHPDDEHGGLLAMLSRGRGARVSLLTLTRGESGANAIGAELFDALGLVRTEELLLSDRYYGVDRQYFGTLVDYGFSKRLDETLEKWGSEHALRDAVAVIRMERPLVVISRFQGNERDGHGNHSAAGMVTRDAFKVAGDPRAFPDQIARGLRPWQPLKLYMGGVRANEAWTIRVDAGEYDPVLGDSYQAIARLGLSFQRSQNSGLASAQPGPSLAYYTRLQSVVDAPAKEETFFDGIDVTLPGLYRALRRTPPADGERLLTAIDRELEAAVRAFSFADPSAAAPPLARALAATRQASAALGGDPDVKFVLARKEEQIAEAIHSAAAVSLVAMAQPAGTPEAAGPFGAALAAMPPVVPGQTFDLRATFVSRGRAAVKNAAVALAAGEGWRLPEPPAAADAVRNQPLVTRFSVTVPADAPLTRPYFSRRSIQETRYTVGDPAQMYRPSAVEPLSVVARYELAGVVVDMRRPVTRLEANLPYGNDTRSLAIVPVLGLSVTPSYAVAPLASRSKTLRISVEVLHNREGKSDGTVRLMVPGGWTAAPAEHRFQFSRAGERALYTFDISMPGLDDREYRIEAIASAGGREYREGYTTIRQRDLETRYLYRDAAATVRGIDVAVTPALQVGYVMGVGDDVPAGISQLGATVRLLAAQDLATGDLGRFDAIVIGTRAYAVRDDLKTYNRRLLDYARDGGNLIVLYNTQEFVPDLYAPYPADLPRGAEEVSEEDSPVEMLAAGHRLLTTPNRITRADFDNWVEQRGSKFWSRWDARYTPLLATNDRGQPPQQGGWLYAAYGKGHYTYFAYALHRQLPYGVPGAYRLLANLLSRSR